MSELVTVEMSAEQVNGMAIRLAMLMTHYRSPINWTEARMVEARRHYTRWVQRMVPCEDFPPEEFMTALMDDLNTPLAITRMHQYAKTDGKKLYASMRMLGLLPNSAQARNDTKKEAAS